MLPETHGEVCRLGYLKLIPLMREPDGRGGISLKKTGENLLEFIKNLEPTNKKCPGILSGRSSLKTAIYYVVLARDLKLLGEELPLLYACKSIQYLESAINGGANNVSHESIIKLSKGERLIFTYVLARRDPLFPGIAEWASKQESFKRRDAILQIMEEVLPHAISNMISKHNGDDAELRLKTILDRIRKYGQQLKEELVKNPVGWIKTRYYGAGRHLIAPRIEWMVDLHLLSRSSGKRRVKRYAPTAALKMTARAICAISATEDCDEMIASLDQIAKSIAPAGLAPHQDEIRRAIARTYRIMAKIVDPVPELALILSSCARLMDCEYKVTPTLVRKELQKMTLLGQVNFKASQESGLLITWISDDPNDDDTQVSSLLFGPHKKFIYADSHPA